MSRDRWDKRTAFIMAAIGSAIGLGNIWRFPYMAYSNGGGAFFIPYIIALLTTGIPLVALEYYLGIRSQQGPTKAYQLINKKSNFIGWFSMGIGATLTIYYAVILAWALKYLYHSVGIDWMGEEQNFFYQKVLGLSSSISEIGSLQWPLVLANFIVWLLIFLIIFKGVKVIGKIVGWTVALPWAMLLILIIRGLTLEGSIQGINYYLSCDFSHLLKPEVWIGAYGQIFYSLSLGFGIMIAYASYLPKRSDINNNAWIVSFANCATSYFAGFAVFSILGYLAFSSQQPIESVVKAGPGLAFIVYPAAISALPGGIIVKSLFGILFFLTLLLLGISSALSLVETTVTGLKDSFNFKRVKTTFWVCFIGFLIGTIYTTNAGLYWLDLVDHWINWGLVIVGLIEAILIGWFCKIKEVGQDMDSTSEMKFGRYWIFCIKYITPLMLGTVLISSIYKELNHPYSGYPLWAIVSGGWFVLTTLFFLSFVFSTRISNLPKIKIFGWIISFLGSLLTFVTFYYCHYKIISVLFLLMSSFIGIYCYRIKEKK